MSAFLANIVALAQLAKKRIVFPEGEDERVREAAERLARDGVVTPVLVGRRPAAGSSVEWVDPDSYSKLETYVDLYYDRRKAKGVTRQEATAAVRRPLYFASLMVANGDVDGMVGGANNTTAETLRAAIRCLGLKPEYRRVSSFMVLVHPDPGFGSRGVMIFADAAVIPDPNPSELADIAIATAENGRRFLADQPRVALLSFSTKGSAEHVLVAKMSEALRIIQQRAPDLIVDGELQADAALVKSVASRKAPDSPVAGQANVLIFPDLNCANIGYKLVERLGGAKSLGPFLQGLSKPANDLSRGCSADDIYYIAAATAIQA